MRRKVTRGKRPRVALVSGILVLAALLALGLAASSYAAPTTTAAGSAATVAPPDAGPAVSDATTSATTTSQPATDGVIPSSGPLSQPPDPNSVHMFQDKDGCLSCHGNPSLIGLMTKQRPDGSSIALYVDRNGLSNSVHRYKDCTSCHTNNPHDVQTPLNKLSLSAKCGSCHDYEYAQWKKSVHGVAQTSTNSDAATCTDCHSVNSNPHNIVRVLDPGATTYPKNIAQTCAKCHNDPKLMDKYGIVEKVYDSYMRSFHGKAMKLQPKNSSIHQLDTATCVNCHGAHNVTSVSDPAAPVAGMDNLLKTCQSCHQNVGPEFVKGFLGHKAVNTAYMPEVYWGGKGFYIFSRAMLTSGLLIVGASISMRSVSRVRRRIRRGKKNEEKEG